MKLDEIVRKIQKEDPDNDTYNWELDKLLRLKLGIIFSTDYIAKTNKELDDEP